MRQGAAALILAILLAFPILGEAGCIPGLYRVTVARDWGNNGTIDEKVFFTFDASGQVIKTESDFDNNGVIDSTDYIPPVPEEEDPGAYTEIHTFVGSGCNPLPDWYLKPETHAPKNVIFVFDGNGRLVEIDEDWCLDNKIEQETYLAYEIHSLPHPPENLRIEPF